MSRRRFYPARVAAALTLTFTFAGLAMTPDFKAEHVARSTSLKVALPAAQAFHLFTPEGEKKWAEGWAPRYLNSSNGAPHAGLVFVTSHGGHETVWTMTRHEPAGGIVEYVRSSPGAWHAIIRVALKASSKAAAVATVTYEYTGLSDEGNEYVRKMDDRRYAEFIGSWESAITKSLAANSR